MKVAQYHSRRMKLSKTVRHPERFPRGSGEIRRDLTQSSDSRKFALFASFAAYLQGLKRLSSVPFTAKCNDSPCLNLGVQSTGKLKAKQKQAL